jgi:hypothetical protein
MRGGGIRDERQAGRPSPPRRSLGRLTRRRPRGYPCAFSAFAVIPARASGQCGGFDASRKAFFVSSPPAGRLLSCALCGAVLLLCPRCFRQRRLCDPCRVQQRRVRCRLANARYQRTAHGARQHAAAQHRYRQRRQHEVTDPDSRPPPLVPIDVPPHDVSTPLPVPVGNPPSAAPPVPVSTPLPVPVGDPPSAAPPVPTSRPASTGDEFGGDRCHRCRRALSGWLVPASFARLPQRRGQARPRIHLDSS